MAVNICFVILRGDGTRARRAYQRNSRTRHASYEVWNGDNLVRIRQFAEAKTWIQALRFFFSTTDRGNDRIGQYIEDRTDTHVITADSERDISLIRRITDIFD